MPSTPPQFSLHSLDHIGLVVSDLAESTKQYQSLFQLKVVAEELLETQKVALVFLEPREPTAGATAIELLQALPGNTNLRSFLEKRGPGLHHLCYRVRDIAAELQRLKNSGVLLIDEQPRPGARNSLIAFLHPQSMGGVLTEVCQYI